MRSPRRWAAVFSVAAITSVIALAWDSSATTLSGSRLSGELSAVSTISSSNAWAVGNYYIRPPDLGDFKSVTEHWHGGTWSRVSAPSPPGYVATLNGVTAVSPTNVWAVGLNNATTGNDKTLIEHWKGSGWKIVRSPNPGRFGNALAGVSAAAANQVWAVGYYGPPKTLILRWNGSSWSRVKSPNPGRFKGNVLSAVSALSKTNAWAVGYYMSDFGPRTLILRWNGTAWRKVAGRNPSGTDNELTGVSAVSSSDVWAVGYYTTSSGDRTLVEHWNGSGWSKVPSPNGAGGSALAAVTALSATNAWAVGSSGSASVKTLIEHWNGTKWTRVGSPNPSTSENELLGVSASSPSDVWAVGYYKTSSGHRTLVEHWNGSTWSVR